MARALSPTRVPSGPAAQAPGEIVDPWAGLRALLARHPGAPVAVAFDSAAWMLGLHPSPPGRQVVAHPHGWRSPSSLGGPRSVSYEWCLPPARHGGLPVWQAATLVVALADRPDAAHDWEGVARWLAPAVRAANPRDIVTELRGRSVSAAIRCAHLAEWSGCGRLVRALGPLVPERLPVTYLGPRHQRGRWVNRWRLYDALLPAR